MKYPFVCQEHGPFEISAPIAEGPPQPTLCPECNGISRRIYTIQKEIWNTDGSSADYFNESQGRGQSMDKKEWLNQNWSNHFGTPPPPEDSVGTYDGVPRKGQLIRKDQ